VSVFRTGNPFSIRTGDDFAGVGSGSGPQYWLVNGDPKLSGDQKKFSTSQADKNYWFSPTNFARPSAGTFTDQNLRNFLYNPGDQNHNLGLFKAFSISERHKFQFRFEAFNWLNHPNWNGAETNPNNANFGKVTTKSSERQLQFALRYSF
jgi:hypothetical protein